MLALCNDDVPVVRTVRCSGPLEPRTALGLAARALSGQRVPRAQPSPVRHALCRSGRPGPRHPTFWVLTVVSARVEDLPKLGFLSRSLPRSSSPWRPPSKTKTNSNLKRSNSIKVPVSNAATGRRERKTPNKKRPERGSNARRKSVSRMAPVVAVFG